MKTKLAAMIPAIAMMANMEPLRSQSIQERAERQRMRHIGQLFGSFVCPDFKCGKRYRKEKALNSHREEVHNES